MENGRAQAALAEEQHQLEGQAPAAARPRRRGRAVDQAVAARRAGRGRGRRGGSAGGRGRGRKRAASRSPSPAPREEEQEAAGSDGQRSSDSGHSSGGEEEGAAAGLQDQQQEPAPALSLRDQAVLLVAGQGVERARAESVVDEVAEKKQYDDAEAWAEDAVLALTELVDFEAERDDMAAAMEVSLEEAQARKAAEKALEDKSADEVMQDFATSCLLLALRARFSPPSLLRPPLHKPLLDFLKLEKKCLRWWDVSSHFFQALADDLVGQLAGLAEEGAPAAGEDAAAGGGGGGGMGAAAAAAAGSAAPPALPIDDNQAALLAALLVSQQGVIESAAFAMPSGDGIQVPELFTAAVPPGAQLDVVEIDCGDEQQQQQQQQQQQGRDAAAAAAAEGGGQEALVPATRAAEA